MAEPGLQLNISVSQFFGFEIEPRYGNGGLDFFLHNQLPVWSFTYQGYNFQCEREDEIAVCPHGEPNPGSVSKSQGYPKAMRENFTKQSHCFVVEAEQKSCFLFSLSLFWIFPPDLPYMSWCMWGFGRGVLLFLWLWLTEGGSGHRTKQMVPVGAHVCMPQQVPVWDGF